MKAKPGYMNLTVDHMTILLHPKLYTLSYVLFRIIMGVRPEDILYEKRRKAKDGKEISMTYATKVGEWSSEEKNPLNTIFALVQPSEGPDESSHVREMLDGHENAAHLQHIALRTNDLLAFHKHCLDRGVQFVTPILKDEDEDLIQAFSGEWFYPGSKPTGLFFEFLQRNPSSAEVAEIQKMNKQTWFRDKTFLGLYNEKEKEYQSGKILPFISEPVFHAVSELIGKKQVWELTEENIARAESLMLEITAKAQKA